MAENTVKAKDFVKQLDFSAGNLATKWKTFKDQFNVFRIVKKLPTLTIDEQVGHLLMCMGSDSVPIYNQFVFCEEADSTTKKSLENAIKFFDAYFEPAKNVIFERSVFNRLHQKAGQSLHQFIVQVQVQSENCEYGAMRDELVRDRIVVGVSDAELRKYLIDIPDLNLATCINKSKQFVAHQEQLATMGQEAASKDNLESGNIDGIQSKPHSSKSIKRDVEHSKDAAKAPRDQCKKCGFWKHYGDRCPAERSKCMSCQKVGHWKKMCRSKNLNELQEEWERMDSLYLGNDSL